MSRFAVGPGQGRVAPRSFHGAEYRIRIDEDASGLRISIEPTGPGTELRVFVTGPRSSRATAIDHVLAALRVDLMNGEE